MNKPFVSTTPGTRWDLVALAVSAGIVGALHIGKVPPSLPILGDDLGLGMVTAGWVASLFNGTAAALGLALGWLLGRLPLRPVLVGCLAVMAAGSAMGAAADGATLLLFARVVEGLGFIGVITAAPRLIAARHCPDGSRARLRHLGDLSAGGHRPGHARHPATAGGGGLAGPVADQRGGRTDLRPAGPVAPVPGIRHPCLPAAAGSDLESPPCWGAPGPGCSPSASPSTRCSGWR